MDWWIYLIIILFIVWLFIFLISSTYSCGGWERGCGLCPIGLSQLPLDVVDWVVTKIKKIKNKSGR